MNKFSVVFKDGIEPGLLIVNADYFKIMEGFLVFYAETLAGPPRSIAAHHASNIKHCVLQNEYTSEEILEQLENAGGDE